MYLFQCQCDCFAQSNTEPTELDFEINSDWKFFKFENGKFFQITKEGTSEVDRQGLTCGQASFLFVDDEVWQSEEEPTGKQMDDVSDEFLFVFKFEKKFFMIDEDGDWNKVRKVTLGDCSEGKYHV